MFLNLQNAPERQPNSGKKIDSERKDMLWNETLRPDISLTDTQQEALRSCFQFFKSCQDKTQKVEPLQLLLHGCPGTGKSFLINTVYEMAQTMDIHIVCMAPTGIAASSLPRGQTLHSALHLPVFKNKKERYHQFYPKLTVDQKIKLQQQLQTDKLKMIVIDEFSCINDNFFGQIDNRMRDIMGADEPFGGIGVLIVGDGLQLPPVASKNSLPSSVIKLKAEQSSLDPQSIPFGPNNRGAELFSAFRKIELIQQIRCASDRKHSAMLNRMRQPKNGQTRVDREYISRIKEFTTGDILQNEEWLTAPIVVTRNKERHLINSIKAKYWSIFKKTPMFTWKPIVTNSKGQPFPSTLQEFIYDTFPQFTNSFVAGAPGYLSQNINPSIGLTNGTRVIYHSLLLDPRENIKNICATWKKKEVIDLQFPPSYLFVKIPNADLANFKHTSITMNSVVIPIKLGNESEKMTYRLQQKKESLTIKYTSHPIDMGFATTVHKIQGQTCERVILDLNPHSFLPQIDFHSLYVGLSRVKNGKNLRLMPLYPQTKNLDYLIHLQPQPIITAWLSGFDSKGYWNTKNVTWDKDENNPKRDKEERSTEETLEGIEHKQRKRKEWEATPQRHSTREKLKPKKNG